MTVAFITEDETDSAVVGALVDRLLGRSLQSTHYLSKRGFGAVLKSARPLAIQAARARSSLIIAMVDCDETDDHYSIGPPHESCRLCQLEGVLPTPREVAMLSGNSSRLIAALTVRTIETWLAVAGNLSIPGSIHSHGTTRAEREELKRIVYGHPKPSSEELLNRGVELARSGDLDRMQTTLSSFAAFAKLVRA